MNVPRSIYLDANILLLLVIGTMDRTLIDRFKRTNEFSRDDFDALISIVSRADKIVTTPHVLTEVSNLANSLSGDQRADFAVVFKAVIQELEERFTPARTLASHPNFHMGIADIAGLNEAGSTLILTQDGRFASEIYAAGGLALDLRSAIELGQQSI